VSMKANLLAAATLLALGASGSASAVAISVGGCSTSDVTNGGFAATSCQGLFTGSGSNQNYDLAAINAYFGGGYTQLGKSDDGFGIVTAGWDIGNPAGGLSHLGVFVRGTSQVPEPGTLALLGMGLLGMAAAARRKLRA
jgi:hypothetical protein